MKLRFTDEQLKTLLDKAYTPEVRNQDDHIRNFAIGMYRMGWKDGQESGVPEGWMLVPIKPPRILNAAPKGEV